MVAVEILSRKVKLGLEPLEQGEAMSRVVMMSAALLMSISESACVSIPQAPGADLVKITRSAADVAGCAPMGNIDFKAGAEPRNLAVGLGGNVVFDTTPSAGAAVGDWTTGIVYRCSSLTKAN